MAKTLTFALIVLLAGCSASDSNNGSTNNGSTNNDSTNNATNNTSSNNSTTNNSTTNNGSTNTATNGRTNNTTDCDLASAEVLVVCREADPTPPECLCAEEVVADVLAADPTCEVERLCGDLIGVDCQSAADGPYDYYDANGEVIERCGGACFTPMPGEDCQECPPESAGWTCETY